MIQSVLSNMVSMAGHLMDKDLGHVTEEQAKETCGGKSRTTLDIVSETASFNKMVTMMMRDEELPPMEDAMKNQAGSLADARKMLAESTKELAGVVEGMSDDQLGTMITAPWGMEMRKADMVVMAGTHVFYHDGQLCHAQLIAGDDQMHWMDE